MEMVLPTIGQRAKRLFSGATALASRFGKSAAIGTIAVAIFTAFLTYLFTAQLNTNSAVQQQRLAAVQTYISTGADVDASITDLVDTIADQGDVLAAKRDARRAIAAHAAAAQSIEPIVGNANITAYLAGVGTLRELVDATTDAENALQTSQARFDVMHNRTQIVAKAREVIYS